MAFVSLIGDAAVACAAAAKNPNGWIPACRAMLQLPVAEFGKDSHAGDLHDIAVLVLSHLHGAVGGVSSEDQGTPCCNFEFLSVQCALAGLLYACRHADGHTAAMLLQLRVAPEILHAAGSFFTP